MDGVTSEQLRSARIWDSTERSNTALVQVLKQACARNRAIEKKEMWDQKKREDHGSASSISLKSRDGEVTSVVKIPKGAIVTDNDVNKYAEERARAADTKEDVQLGRFCDGNDVAWRPDTFFTANCGQDEVPPWPIRPTELFTNPTILTRIMAQQMEKRKEKKAQKKAAQREAKEERKAKRMAEAGGERKDAAKSSKRKKDKRAKKKKKGKKGKKDKKSGKKAKKEKKSKKKKEKRRRTRDEKVNSQGKSSRGKRKAKTSDSSTEEQDSTSSSGSSDERVRGPQVIRADQATAAEPATGSQGASAGRRSSQNRSSSSCDSAAEQADDVGAASCSPPAASDAPDWDCSSSSSN